MTSRSKSLSDLEELFPYRERLYGLNVDFSDEDAASLISTFVKQLPLALHGLVLNAGYISTSPSLMTARQLIIDHMEINFLNPLATTQLLVRKHLLKRRLGSVVYVSSSAAKYANPGRMAYAASKAAMDTSMRVMSRELAQYGIRFNSIHPGLTDTRLMHDSTEISEIEKAVQLTDTKKLATPDQIAPLVSFLLSASSNHITGQQISVDGGI